MATKPRKKGKKEKMTVSQRAAQGRIGSIAMSPDEALVLAMCIRHGVMHLDPPDDVVITLGWIGAQLETVFGLTVCEQCNMPCYPGDECQSEDSCDCE
jgi:hypothetical protein